MEYLPVDIVDGVWVTYNLDFPGVFCLPNGKKVETKYFARIVCKCGEILGQHTTMRLSGYYNSMSECKHPWIPVQDYSKLYGIPAGDTATIIPSMNTKAEWDI